MLRVKLGKSSLSGSFKAPRSKSVTQRLLIASLLAEGKCNIRDVEFTDDVKVAVNLVDALGGIVESSRKCVVIDGSGVVDELPGGSVFLGGSGFTYRVGVALASTAKRGVLHLECDETLKKRPIGDLVKALRRLGARIRYVEVEGKPPVVVEGGLKGGTVEIRGDISSQYLSALVYAGVASEEGVEIKVASNIVSKKYLELTVKLLKTLGGDVDFDEEAETIYAYPSKITPFTIEVPGDYALAVYPMCITAIAGSKVEAYGFTTSDILNVDKVIVEILKEMGVSSVITENSWSVKKCELLEGVEVDLGDNPDLTPPVAALAAYARGKTVIKGVSHLAFKESNRLLTICSTLKRFNVTCRVKGDTMIIEGSTRTYGTLFRSPKDHRIVMLASVLGLTSNGLTLIENAEYVKKSYLNYWEVLRSLGGRVEVE